ncbi:4-alpha-glucanotransferase [Bifidobacterium gallicum]|uniref:4-alpha-glucanotransferase n=1 Tax=Bifidobacterium gallicum DSM 20093 = LMG 11596 TaxID=561180 RepID=D1NX18_9BIFI|nr:4-alpha-glucanotransferase [Bifidobacterium gallicum]EFA22078.1 4-alpha-glucanotransferase [Bifidobacterium gallicum DSM 20093 = LMG 11596]KFI59352.1 4-alpha-glucanotransferase [Bifidobacterium gallicum DSM 20093 = LMG 11596]
MPNEPRNESAQQRTESAERLARPLIQLANLWGVSTAYIDQVGTYVEIADESLVTVLGALGVDASSDALIDEALERIRTSMHTQLVPPTIVKFTGVNSSVEVRVPAGAKPQVAISLEQGGQAADDAATLEFAAHDDDVDVYTLTIADSLPEGYHHLSVSDGTETAESTVLRAAARIPLPKSMDRQRWGWMTQMYSVRGPESWGVGDYGDLQQLAGDAAAKSGADFMLINPIHASAPITPLEPSPYLPESRRFLNVTYIRPQNIAEYQQLEAIETPESARVLNEIKTLHERVAADNLNPDPININDAWDAKREALRLIFEQPRSAERQAAFDAFKQAAGEDLEAFALWSVAFEVWGAPWQAENDWFHKLDKHSPEIAKLKSEYHDMFEFECWLQWIADEQVAAAQQAAKDNGMALGLMQDMAVGVHTYGSDVWWSPERFAIGHVTVGCPPDFYNQQGQDWGQPPFNPNYLEATGYQVYREMVHNMFAHAGAIRIDHVLGLFRLWWIPAGKGPTAGAYVRYNYEAMLAVLTIEASRAEGLVIGEDLGTVPEFVRTTLSEHGVLGADVEWFARVGNSGTAGDPYMQPSEYRKYALASVTTHDLPPTAGYLLYDHVALRDELHLLKEPVEEFRKAAEAEQHAMLKVLAEGGWLSPEAAADVPNHVQEVVEAMHRMLKATPSLLMQAALVDGVGERRTQNQPGTSTEYPNWRIPLADADGNVVPTDQVFDSPRVQALSAIMNG